MFECQRSKRQAFEKYFSEDCYSSMLAILLIRDSALARAIAIHSCASDMQKWAENGLTQHTRQRPDTVIRTVTICFWVTL